MGYLGEEVKKLGFGLMRLPKIGDEFDIEQIKKMVDAFIAAGGTYFDTAFGCGNIRFSIASNSSSSSVI